MDRARQQFKTTDEYIKLFPADVQEKLTELRAAIKEEAPDATEAIKYGIPTFIFHGNLVHFAAYDQHIGFYPGPAGIEILKEAEQYKTGKGTLQFPLDKPLPLNLVRTIVKYRVQANLARKKPKR